MQESKEPFNINDFSSDLNSNFNANEKKDDKAELIKKILIIGGLSLLTIIIIIQVIILVIPDSSIKGSEARNSLGEINCIYEIDSIINKTLILGEEFIKESNFLIKIDGLVVNQYVKEYSFSKSGVHNITIELYEDINMDNMFKDVKNLRIVDMNTNVGKKFYQ